MMPSSRPSRASHWSITPCLMTCQASSVIHSLPLTGLPMLLIQIDQAPRCVMGVAGEPMTWKNAFSLRSHSHLPEWKKTTHNA